MWRMVHVERTSFNRDEMVLLLLLSFLRHRRPGSRPSNLGRNVRNFPNGFSDDRKGAVISRLGE